MDFTILIAILSVIAAVYALFAIYGFFLLFRASPVLGFIVLALSISTGIGLILPFIFGVSKAMFHKDLAKAIAAHYDL